MGELEPFSVLVQRANDAKHGQSEHVDQIHQRQARGNPDKSFPPEGGKSQHGGQEDGHNLNRAAFGDDSEGKRAGLVVAFRTLTLVNRLLNSSELLQPGLHRRLLAVFFRGVQFLVFAYPVGPPLEFVYLAGNAGFQHKKHARATGGVRPFPVLLRLIFESLLAFSGVPRAVGPFLPRDERPVGRGGDLLGCGGVPARAPGRQRGPDLPRRHVTHGPPLHDGTVPDPTQHP